MYLEQMDEQVIWNYNSKEYNKRHNTQCARIDTQRPEHYETWSYHFWVNFPFNDSIIASFFEMYVCLVALTFTPLELMT